MPYAIVSRHVSDLAEEGEIERAPRAAVVYLKSVEHIDSGARWHNIGKVAIDGPNERHLDNVR